MKKLTFILLALILTFTPSIAFAENQSEVNVPLAVSSSVSLNENDYYQVTFVSAQGNVTRTIYPSKIMNGTQQLLLPEGEYTTKQVMYLGSTPEVITSGTAIDKTFTVKNGEENGISFYIGEDNIEKAGEKELVKDTSPAVDPDSVTETTEDTTENAPEATTEHVENNTEAPQETNTSEEGSTADTTAEPATEATTEATEATTKGKKETKEKKKEPKEKTSSPLRKLIVFAVLAIGLGGATFIWYRENRE